MLGTVLVLAALLVVPGFLLLRALRPAPAAAEEWIEDLGWSVALSVALITVVGTALGALGLYRFARTGLPAVEATLLALAAVCGALAWRRAAARRAGGEAVGGDAA